MRATGGGVEHLVERSKTRVQWWRKMRALQIVRTRGAAVCGEMWKEAAMEGENTKLSRSFIIQ